MKWRDNGLQDDVKPYLHATGDTKGYVVPYGQRLYKFNMNKGSFIGQEAFRIRRIPCVFKCGQEREENRKTDKTKLMSTNYYPVTLSSSPLRKLTQTSHKLKTQHIEKERKP